MAAFCKYKTFLRSLPILNVRAVPLYLQWRNSVYSPIYHPPSFRKEDVAELAEEDPRRYQPIKAAQTDETSLSSYDQLITKFTRIILREGNRDRARLIIEKASCDQSIELLLTGTCNGCFGTVTLECIKLTQIEKFHKAQSDFERESIILDPKKIVYQAVENCKPLLILQKVKRGGVQYQVPIPVKSNYQRFKAIKWLVEAADDKHKDTRIWDQLANEILDAYNNEGKSIRKKQELHRVCEANRAYAHFRW